MPAPPLRGEARPGGGGPPAGPPRRSARRWLRRGLALLLGGPLLLVAVLLLGLQTGPGRALLAGVLEDSVPGLRIGRLAGAPPFEVVVQDVSLADAQGPWLTLDRGRLDWAPTALLGGTLSVTALELGKLEIARAPAAPETAAPAPEATPQADPGGLPLPPPLGLRVERLEVTRLALGAPLLGERLELGIDGRLAAGDGARIDSAVRVVRLDGEGEVTAEAVYRPAERSLEAELTAAAPQGGLASRLLGLPGAPPLSARLRGSGPLEGWRGDWSLRAGAVADAEGVLTLAEVAPLRLRLDGRARAAALLPEALRGLAAPQIDLALAATYGADSLGVTIERLDSGALALDGFADLDLTEETLAGQLDLRLRDPAALSGLIAPAALDGGALSLVAEGPLAAPELLLSGSLEAPRAAGLGAERLRLAGQASAALPAVFDLQVTAEGLSGPPALRQALGPELALSARGRATAAAVTLERLALTGAPLSVTGDGAVELAGPVADLALSLDYAALDRLGPLAGLDLAGAWQGEAYLGLDARGAASVLLSGQAAGLSLGLPAADALLGPQPSLWAEAALSPGGALSLDRFELGGQALALRGRGRLGAASGELEAGLTAELPDLAVLQPSGLPLSGTGRLELSATGSLAAPEVTLEARVPRLELAGRDLRELTLTARTAGLPPELTGRLALAAGTPAGRVDLTGDLAVGAERLRLDGLRLTRGGDRLDGSLALPLSGPPAEGRLTLSLADLGAYRELLPELAGGRVAAELALSARGGGQAAELSLQAGDLRLADGTRLAAAELQASLARLLDDPRLEAAAELRDLRAAGLALDEVKAGADGGLADLGVTLEAAGQTAAAEPRPLSLSAAGRLGIGQTLEAELARLEGRYGTLEARLRQPARLAVGGTRLSARGLRLALNEGEVDLDLELDARRVEAQLDLRDLPLSLAAAAGADLPLEGRMQGRARIAGTLPRPEGELRLRTEGLRFAERLAAETPPLDLRVDGRLSGGRLEATAALSGFAEEELRAEAALPLLLTGPPSGLELPETEPVSARLRWSGSLAPVVGLLPVDVVRIEGQGELDLSLGGSLADPVASGSLSVRDGLYENYTLGTLLRPFRLRVEGEGSRLVLREFYAEDADGGGMSVTGWLDLAGEVPSFDLTAEASNAMLVRRDDLRVEVDSQLALAGDLNDATLSGGIQSEQIEVSIAGDLPPSVPVLEVEEINTGRPAPQPQDAGDDQGLAFLKLDVGIEIPGQLFIRGRGLDSEWQGSFRLTGTAAAPRLQGDLRPVRGFFDLAGKQFQLEQGRIAFTGGADLDPQLDLTTVYSEDGFTARIAITGPASGPELGLSSQPDLPNDEILARILFGEGTARLSAVQAVQVAQAAAALAGGGAGVLDYARQTLGVDVLSFAPGAEEGDLGQVEAGKYLADDLFVGVRQGATPGSSSAVVEWEITPNLSLESEVGGASQENNLGVIWEWDY